MVNLSKMVKYFYYDIQIKSLCSMRKFIFIINFKLQKKY